MEAARRKGFGPTLIVAFVGLFPALGGVAYADCLNPVNAIEVENCLPGNPPSEWDITGAGDASIQGFATDISVNHGETIDFKVKSTRKQLPARHLPARLLRRKRGAQGRDGQPVGRACRRTQPACLYELRPASSTAATGPSPRRGPCRRARPRASTSRRLVREDDGRREPHRLRRARRRRRHPTSSSRPPTRRGRPTTATAATASTTLGAGGGLSGLGRAYKVSYNRPFVTRESRARGLALQRRVPDGPLARSATATT